jgi:basic membrane lipoprotein Med (substrate-binding protein (PBP1-ABC) superfamily)
VLWGDGRSWLEPIEKAFAAGFRAQKRRGMIVSADGVDGVERFAAEGIDVALYASDTADPVVLGAVRESGLKLVVTDRSVMDSHRDLVLAVVDIDVAEAMVRVARDVRDGVFIARVFTFDLGSGVVNVEINGDLPKQTLEQARQVQAAASAEVTAGYVAFDELGL